ncbi:MAG: protein kinase [Deltaproteobacteria bacterium]|nr:protein kinase [Deltaproteobacteria bacterium]
MVATPAESTDEDVPPGTVVLGRYQILGKLAQGGMAEVYLARQVGPGGYQKLVVIKRVRPHLAKDSDFIGMFVNEARLAAMINHPHVVQIFDLGEDDNAHGGTDWFLAMEYLDGRDMLQVGRACRSHNKAVPFDVTARIISDACAGLEHAHNLRGADGKLLDLVHRDMSPENVIITFEGQVKVVDFGIAKARDNSIRTQAGQIKGKLGYVAPEAILGKPVDARADIFAIGATLYLFLSGRPAFSGATPMEIFERSLKPPPSPSEVNNRVPPVLDQICVKALAQDRDQRYRTAGEVRQALDAYLTSTGRPLGPPQLAQFMRILFPPEKDPVRQRIEGLLAAAQSFDMPKTRVPPAPASNAPRTISVPQMPKAPPPAQPSVSEDTAVSGPDRTMPSIAPRAVEMPAPHPSSGSATVPAQRPATVAAPVRPSAPVAAPRPSTPFRSVGVSDEIPDVSNPRGAYPPPPVEDDGRTHVTAAPLVPVTAEADVIATLDASPAVRAPVSASARAALDEATLGVDLDVEVGGRTDVTNNLGAARAALEADDLLSDDDIGDAVAAATVRTAPTSMPPVPSGEDVSDADTVLRGPLGGSASQPPVQPEVSGSLFAPPAADLAREDLVEVPAVAARRASTGEISIALRLAMAALGVATGALLIMITLLLLGKI